MMSFQGRWQPSTFQVAPTLRSPIGSFRTYPTQKVHPKFLTSLPITSLKSNQYDAPSTTPSLQPSQLASSLSTVVFTAIVLKMLGLRLQSNRTLTAAARMSVQLMCVGMILSPLFSFASFHPWRITAWISLVAFLAAREAATRSKYAYRGQKRDCFIAMFSGVGFTLLHLISFALRPSLSSSSLESPLNAQTIIPISGMLFGNSLSATSLGMSILLSNFVDTGRERVELRLSRGAGIWEAALPVVREAIEAALLPTINAMAATGIIFMPGMMTGQILGGRTPSAAAAHQIMIYSAICSSSCLATVSLAVIVTTRMFDLRLKALIPRRKIPGLLAKSDSNDRKNRVIDVRNIIKMLGLNRGDENNKKPNEYSSTEEQLLNKTTARYEVFKDEADSNEDEIILSIRNLAVESTNLTINSLDIYQGDRVGVVAPSGAGKTQLFRTIAKLDPCLEKDSLWLRGKSWRRICPSNWRSQVMWVSQDRPTLSGTPGDFCKEIMCYRSRMQHNHVNNLMNPETPKNIAEQWNLPLSTWDRPWSELSGGEAQRASLAIALALQPQLILLDEPTSSCDKEATLLIEKTLREQNITLMIVSHSEEQVARLCTSKIML